MKRHDFEIQLTVRAPFLFPAIEAGGFGFDRVALRDKDGRLLIPHDQMRGVLRAMMFRVARLRDDAEAACEMLSKLFGKASGEARDGSHSLLPNRTSLFFEDLVAPQTERLSVPYTRIKIDEEAGAVAAGHLLTIEASAPPRAEITFSGRLTAFCPDPDLFKAIADVALKSLQQIGAYETIGFGVVTQGKLSELPVVDVSSSQLHPKEGADLLEWKFELDRAYLVDAERIADNVFVGSVRIPGGALKGALIRNLEMRGVDVAANQDDLARMRISFADLEGSAAPLPFSTVVCEDNRELSVVDLTQSPKASGLQEKDWKQKHAAAAEKSALAKSGSQSCAQAVTWQERMHVAISEETGTAEDQKLFSNVAVDVGTKAHIAQLDLSRVKSDELKLEILSVIADGIFGLGKTGAVVRHSELCASQSNDALQAKGTTRVALMLETDALLACPQGSKDAWQCYADCFAELLPGTVLQEHYARQRLAGGYWAHRFNHTDVGIAPFVLTTSGSVFVLDVPSEQIEPLNCLLSHGVVSTQQTDKAKDWKYNPFVPENGYGSLKVLWSSPVGEAL